MSTPEELAPADGLRSALNEAREALRMAIEAAAGGWNRKPAAGEGEDAWSAREAAEHVCKQHVRYAKAVCDACGYPGPEIPEFSFPTWASALEGLVQATALSHGRLKYVSGKDMQMKHERLGTVEEIMMRDADHLKTHAEQIRAASGAT